MADGACWACGQPTAAAAFCPGCGRIQPVPEDVDYFALLGLPRRLDLDLTELEESFYALSRRFHPDRFGNAGPEEQDYSTGRSSAVNIAYRTLRDPIARARYVLKLHGLLPEEGKAQAPPQAFLMEVLEIQETLGEYTTAAPAERAGLRARLEEARERLLGRIRDEDALVQELFRQHDVAAGGDGAGLTEGQRAVLKELEAILNTRKYLTNLVGKIDEALQSPET